MFDTLSPHVQQVALGIGYRLGRPNWVIDRPQSGLVRLVEEGGLRGTTVLDVGCGTGDNAMYLAEQGFAVTGIDVCSTAIKRAQQKAQGRGLTVEFLVHDAFRLAELGHTFDCVLDFGVLHQYRGQTRTRYLRSLRDACTLGGQLIIQCFSDQGGRAEPLGPRRLAETELREILADGWSVERICPSWYEAKKGRQRPAWLAEVTRIATA